MNKTLNTLDEKLASLHFEEIYPGFKKYPYALYDQKQVYFQDKVLPWDDRFIGNTAILYDGKYIAIWNVKYLVEDSDIFASKIVHEMFHAHQFTCGETRFPNEIKALHYTYNNQNISMKFDETNDLFEGNIQSFIKKRNARSKLYEDEVIYETCIEQVEGCARFVELQALKQLNKVKYEDELQKVENSVRQISNYLPVRTVSYEIGALLFDIVKERKLSYIEDFALQETIFEQIRNEEIAETSDFVSFDTPFIDKYYHDLSKKITQIIDRSENKLEFIRITGLDPMNTSTYKNYIYFKDFVRVQLQNNQMKMIMKEAVCLKNSKNNLYILYY